ncbi:LexA family protein [Faecalibacillus intestinalis]|uniref:LexA family protein n=1 Tax=Faecalibacillus intestinalis TaxID=1982626 RepID=UPI0022E84B3C|nr:S24 family peptidase [Faecalibacillus intestinalis]
MKLRQILIQYEIEHNMTHDEMIEMIGVGRSTYFRWLSGESTQLKHNTMTKLSNALECDVEELLSDETQYKPILGSVKAGYDLFADENVEGYVELGKEDARLGDYFLRIVGDSMINDNIHEDDLVYVQQTSCVPSGKIGIVMVGDEVTIKRIYYKNDLLILEAANPKYETKFFNQEEIESLPVQIIGLARFVRRNLA